MARLTRAESRGYLESHGHAVSSSYEKRSELSVVWLGQGAGGFSKHQIGDQVEGQVAGYL